MAESITLEQLAGGSSVGGHINPDTVEKINITTVAPEAPEIDVPARNEFEKEAYDAIDDGITRFTNEIREDYLDYAEKMDAQGGDEDDIQETKINTDVTVSNKSETKSANSEEKEVSLESDTEYVPEDDDDVDISNGSITVDDDDFLDLDEDAEEKESQIDAEKLYDEYKDSIKKNIKVLDDNDIIDISSFRKGDAISSVRALDKSSARTVSVIADHVLFTSGRSITIESLDSDEIVQFNPSIIQNMFDRAAARVRRGADNVTEDTIATINSFRHYNTLFTCIYRHIKEDHKPSYNEWLKSINWADVGDIFFAAFKATYGITSNKITVTCNNEECSSIFVQECDIEKMIKFGSDEDKKRYNDIMNLGPGLSIPTEPVIKQVSRDYVFTFKSPSLYTMVVEATGVDPAILKKYNNLFSIYQYIDKIEFIDREAGELKPIKFNTYPNINKTVKGKLKIISDILKTMTLDQRQAVLATTASLDRNPDSMYYVIPETTCEKCKTVIEESRVNSADLLFTRFQLIAHLS